MSNPLLHIGYHKTATRLARTFPSARVAVFGEELGDWIEDRYRANNRRLLDTADVPPSLHDCPL